MNTPLPAASADSWSLARPGARRSLILCALGAVLGLAVAGLGLFSARGTRTSGVPAEDIAVVNQVPILLSDYVLQLRTLYDVSLSQATPGQKRAALDSMIREELYVQRGIELGMQSDTVEVRAALVGAVEEQTAADATMAQPGDEDLRHYYDRHRGDFASEGKMTLADYVLPAGSSPAAVGTARAALQSGGAPTGARRTGAMADGEEFYFAARIHLGDRLFAAAQVLNAGQVSPPVVMPDGIHLLVMQTNVQPLPAPYGDVRDKVLAAYVTAQTAILAAANERFLRKRADIQIAKGY